MILKVTKELNNTDNIKLIKNVAYSRLLDGFEI